MIKKQYCSDWKQVILNNVKNFIWAKALRIFKIRLLNFDINHVSDQVRNEFE